MKPTQSIALGILLAAQVAALAVTPDAPGKGGVPSPFTVTDATQVPGKVLKKGAYTIQILDHLSDRMIVQVDRDGKMLSTFLALRSSGLPKPAAQGPIILSAGVNAKGAIRGFAFPDGTVAEFVYSKGEAVGLAKANNTTIPAIDPESQGLSGNPALSKTDREMVTLWMLSPTPVGPNDSGPGIKAERYQTEKASADAVPARPRARPAMAALPHTAGMMPLVLLVGLMSLFGAAMLKLRRVTVEGR